MNEIIFKEINKADYQKAIDYSQVGMHNDIYFDGKEKGMSSVYSKFFFFEELNKSTGSIAAYYNNEFAGVLLFSIFGKTKIKLTKEEQDFLDKANNLRKNAKGIEDYVSKLDNAIDMYTKKEKPDGQLNFFVVNPNLNGKGIGTKIINEFKRQYSNMKVFLFTDDQCSFEFYEHRNFRKVYEGDTVLHLTRDINLKILLYDINTSDN